MRARRSNRLADTAAFGPTCSGGSVGRAVGRSIGRSAGRSVGRYLGRSLGRSVARSAGRSVNPSVGRSVGRSAGRPVGWPAVGSVGSVGRSVGRSAGPGGSSDAEISCRSVRFGLVGSVEDVGSEAEEPRVIKLYKGTGSPGCRIRGHSLFPTFPKGSRRPGTRRCA